MRLFAAVFPPLPVRADIAATLADLPALEGLRITRPENLHVTLAFFGDQPEGAAGRIARALERASSSVPAFAARAAGVSGFPAGDRARVLFVGMEDGAAGLSMLHDRLMEELDADLRPRAGDRFQAHLTFSRPKKQLPRGQFEEIQAQARPWSWQFRVDAVHLVRSETLPAGARYSVLASSGLGG
jgi:2'-5' RNA ligase